MTGDARERALRSVVRELGLTDVALAGSGLEFPFTPPQLSSPCHREAARSLLTVLRPAGRRRRTALEYFPARLVRRHLALCRPPWTDGRERARARDRHHRAIWVSISPQAMAACLDTHDQDPELVYGRLLETTASPPLKPFCSHLPNVKRGAAAR